MEHQGKTPFNLDTFQTTSQSSRISTPVKQLAPESRSASPTRPRLVLSEQTPFGKPASIQKTQIATSEPLVANKKKLAQNIRQALQRALESNQGHPIKKFAASIQTAALKKNSPTKNLAPQVRNVVVSRGSTLQTTQPPTNITQTIFTQQAKTSTKSGANFIQTTLRLTASTNEPVLSTTTIKNDTVFEQVNINKKRKLSNPTDGAIQPVFKNKKTEGAVNTIYKEADTNTSKDQPITKQTESQAVPPKHFKKDDFKIASELQQFLKNVDEYVLECNICFKKLQNPKSLNCLHSFCLACLEHWVKAKRELTCPTCAKSYPIPEGGLQKLPPNTFINNLLETMEQLSKKDELKCVCGNEEETKHYCQDCKQYLCSACSDHHKNFRLFANHKLHSVDDMRTMSSSQIASLHPPMCSIHNESLKFFCSVCCIPICMHCTINDHREWEGNHKTISISEAFETFKESSVVLEKAAHQLKNKLHDGIKAVTQNVTYLEESKDTSLRDIDNHVQEITEKINKRIREDGERMKNVVMRTYRKRKTVLDAQMNELNTTVSDINTKLSFLNQMLRSDEATALLSSASVTKALKDRINESPKSEPNHTGKIKFLKSKVPLLQCKVGKVGITQKKKKNEGLANTIKIYIRIQDVAKCVDCFLVSCWDNVIYKYNQSGGYIGKVKLPKGVKVNKMYRMMNGNIIFSEYLKHIRVCNVNGKIIRSIGEGVLMDPTGIYVDETSNVLYVGEWHISCVFMFDINSGQLIRTIGSKGKLEGQMNGVEDVALTNQGHLIVPEYYNNRVQLFDNEGSFVKILVEEGDENGKVMNPRGVAVDEDGNIIISSKHKLQLFSSDGNFIKRIDKEEDGINNPLGLCIISHHPRRVAVANPHDHTVKIFNY